jgi:hypothetical protein
MQVNTNTNQYQLLQTQQQPVTLPVEPKDPIYSNREIYDASQGNIIRDDEGNLTLTPQGQVNYNNEKEALAAQTAATIQAEKDALRATATDFIEQSSKKSQLEIYFAVATDGESAEDDTTIEVLSNLRDVQKQNNTIEAYAKYQEAQNSTNPSFY